jgi:hypothetical protein
MPGDAEILKAHIFPNIFLQAFPETLVKHLRVPGLSLHNPKSLNLC